MHPSLCHRGLRTKIAQRITEMDERGPSITWSIITSPSHLPVPCTRHFAAARLRTFTSMQAQGARCMPCHVHHLWSAHVCTFMPADSPHVHAPIPCHTMPPQRASGPRVMTLTTLPFAHGRRLRRTNCLAHGLTLATHHWPRTTGHAPLATHHCSCRHHQWSYPSQNALRMSHVHMHVRPS